MMFDQVRADHRCKGGRLFSTVIWTATMIGVASAIGCEAHAPEEPEAPASTKATDITACEITDTGYVNTHFRFGVGFDASWRTIGPAELAAAAESMALRKTALLYLTRDGNAIKFWAHPGRTTRDALGEIVQNAEASTTASVLQPIRDVTVGGRTGVRVDTIDEMGHSFYTTAFAFEDQDHAIVISTFSTDRKMVDELADVVQTLMFY